MAAVSAWGANGTTVGTFTTIAMPTSIHVYGIFSGDDNTNVSAVVQWSDDGGTSWKTAHGPYRDHRVVIDGNANEHSNQVRTVIFGLTAGTSYKVRVDYSDSDGITGTEPITNTLTTIALAVPTNGPIKYVAATNSAEGDGSSDNPYKTITNAHENAVAGDVIRVRSGTYVPMVWTKSGNSGAYIVVENESGAVVDVKGTNRNNINVNADFVKFRGLRFPESQTNTFELLSGTTFIHIDDCHATNCNVARNTSAPGFIAPPVTGAHLNISNIYAYGCSMLSTANVLAAGGNAAALSMGDAANFMRNIYFGSNTVRGSFWDHVGGGAGTLGRGFYENWVCEYNLHQDVDAVTRYRDDFYEVDGEGVNCLLLRNKMYGSSSGAAGFSLAPVMFGPLFILGNLYEGTNFLTAIIKQGDPNDVDKGPVYIYHNTLSAKFSTDGGQNVCTEAWSRGGEPKSHSRTFRNNIMVAYGTVVVTNANNSPRLNSFNYNCYTNSQSSTGNLFTDFNQSAANDYTTIAAFTAAHGDEANGVFADPLFDDYTLATLQATSVCRNTGLIIVGINDWTGSPLLYQGSAPDMGWSEFQEAPTQPPLKMTISGRVDISGRVTLGQ